MKRDSAELCGQLFDASEASVAGAVDAQRAAVLSRRVQAAAVIVRNRYRDGVNARQVARLIGVDRSRLATTFRQQTGLTLHEYIVQVRLRAAVTMIASGTKIEAVALLVGYRDKSTFYRQFRRHTGVTPAAYRPGSQPPSALPPGRLLLDAVADEPLKRSTRSEQLTLRPPASQWRRERTASA